MINTDVKMVSFESLLQRDVTMLRLIGLHSMNDVFTNKMEKPMIWESVIFEIALLNLAAAVWFEIRSALEAWNDDPEYVIGVMSAIVSGSLCFIKGGRLWFCRDELRKLLRQFAILWYEANSRIRIREENTKTAMETCFITKLSTIMTASLGITFAIRPYMLLLKYYTSGRFKNESYDYTVTVYAASYPWPTNTISKYILCISWEQFVLFFVILYLIAADVTFAQLTTHTAIQFRVLRHDLKYITDAENDQAEKDERKLMNQLSAIVKRHCDLYTYCELIEQVYNPIVFLTLTFTAVHMCFSAFHLRKEMMYGNWDEVAKDLLHSMAVVVQALILCGYSQKLTEQSALIAKAVYECEWMDRSNQFKIMLGLIMIRSQRPFVCSAYGFFSLNLNQMTSIFRAAGSYFALLQSLA